jgi:hypothetical protein
VKGRDRDGLVGKRKIRKWMIWKMTADEIVGLSEGIMGDDGMKGMNELVKGKAGMDDMEKKGNMYIV